MNSKQHLCSDCQHIKVCMFFAEFVRCLSQSEKLNVLDMSGIVNCQHYRVEKGRVEIPAATSDDALQEKLNSFLEPENTLKASSAMAKKISHETECTRCGVTYDLNDTELCSVCGKALCPDCVIIEMGSDSVFCAECYDKSAPSLS